MVHRATYQKTGQVNPPGYTKLEDKIMRVWSTGDDLEDFVLQFYEGSERMTEDDVFNIVWGLKELHNIRCKQLFDTYKRVFQLDEYNPEAVDFFNRQYDKEGECND